MILVNKYIFTCLDNDFLKLCFFIVAKDPVSSNTTSQPSNTTAEEEKPPPAVEVVPDPPMMSGMMGGINLNPAIPGNVPGNPANPTGKKEKKKKEKKFIRLAANTTWEDQTLAEWQQGN